MSESLNEIFSFAHCRLCTEQHLDSNLECGWTKIGFKVICETHNVELISFPLPPKLIPSGCDCTQCKEKLLSN